MRTQEHWTLVHVSDEKLFLPSFLVVPARPGHWILLLFFLVVLSRSCCGCGGMPGNGLQGDLARLLSH